MISGHADIKGCRALVTGGATGIGRSLAARLAELGCSVTICGRRQNALDDAVSHISAVQGAGKVRAYKADITDEQNVQDLLNSMQNEGGLDILINCAGIARNSSIEDMDLQSFSEMLQTNVLGTFLICKHAIPLLRNSKRAFIINLCSAASHSFRAGQAGYSASKSALLSFTKTLALETWKDGIRVHAISPGAVLTDMIRVARPDLTDEPMISPEDIADVMEFFLTHRTNAVVDEMVVHRISGQPWPYNV